MRSVTRLATEPPEGDALDPYRPLVAMLTRGRGPHPIPLLGEVTGLPRPQVRGYLRAMAQVGLCMPTSGMPGHYELTVPVVGSDVNWLLHSFPGAAAGDRDLLGELHQATGQVVLVHSHMLYPAPVRLWVDYWCGDADGFLRQLAAHPTAAGRLSQAPLDADAPGEVISAYLDSTQPLSAELEAIRTRGYKVGPAPLAGWSFVSVPIHIAPEDLGRPEYSIPKIAGAVSLLARTPDVEPSLLPWLTALQDTARSLSRTTHLAGHTLRPVLKAI